MKDLLLIWEMVPESLDYYLLVGLSEVDYGRIVALNGLRGGSVATLSLEEEEITWLSEFLDKKEKLRVEKRQPIEFSGIVVDCGYLM